MTSRVLGKGDTVLCKSPILSTTKSMKRSGISKPKKDIPEEGDDFFEENEDEG